MPRELVWADKIRSALSEGSVTRVSFEAWRVLLVIKDCEVILEGSWQLIDREGNMVDWSMPLSQREMFGLWKLVTNEVQSINIEQTANLVLTLTFSNGMTLIAMSDEDGFEDWSVIGNDVLVIVNGREE